MQPRSPVLHSSSSTEPPNALKIAAAPRRARERVSPLVSPLGARSLSAAARAAAGASAPRVFGSSRTVGRSGEERASFLPSRSLPALLPWRPSNT